MDARGQRLLGAWLDGLGPQQPASLYLLLDELCNGLDVSRHNPFGFLRLSEGDNDDVAIEQLERAMRLDPLSPINRDARMLVGTARFRHGQFAEALSLLSEAGSPQPYAHAHLAAVLGHLGRIEAAREALARYRASADTPIELAANLWFSRPEHRKLFLDGIALAEGKAPTSN